MSRLGRVLVVNHGPGELALTSRGQKKVLAAGDHVGFEQRDMAVVVEGTGSKVLLLNLRPIVLEVQHRGPVARAVEGADSDESIASSWKPPVTGKRLFGFRKVTTIPPRSEAIFVHENFPLRIG